MIGSQAKRRQGKHTGLAAAVAGAASLVLAVLGLCAPVASATPTIFLNSFFLDKISAYSVASNGSLTPVPGSPFATGIAPEGVAVTPDGRFLYVGNFESGSVSAYSIAPNGSLSPVAGSPFHTGTWPWGLAVSPDGGHLFVSNSGSDNVSSFFIAADGSLTPVPGSPFHTATGARSNGVAVTPDGRHLYVPSGVGRNIVAFSIAADGSLTPLAGSPFEAGETPREVAVTPDGSHLYVSNVSSGNISAYSIAADGSLNPVTGSPFATEGAPQDLAVTPDGENLYVTHVGGEGGVLWGYSIAADGSLSPIPGAPFATGGYRTSGVGASADGRHLYVTTRRVLGPRIISAYSIAADGHLGMLAGFPLATEEASWGGITPDQGPLAAFSATPKPAGDPSSLDASASSDPDGAVASYQWDFGDGQTLVTSDSAIAHHYSAPGDYTVALTVIDDAGCSTEQIFTGQTASCNGSSLAHVSHQVTVPPGVPLSVSTAGSGSGSVASSPSGIACPGACSYSYEPGMEVTLVANPATGSTFAGWSGGGCSGTGTCQVMLDAESEITATFSRPPPSPAPSPPPSPPGDSPPSDSSGGGGEGNGREGAVAAPVSARLRVSHVRSRPGPQGSRPAIVVSGSVVTQASGSVSVKAVTHSDRRTVAATARARIAHGHWRARLELPGVNPRPIHISARFGGSAGVQSDQANRLVRLR